MPKQRIGWNDFRVDYEEFSHKLDDKHFPPGESWVKRAARVAPASRGRRVK